ncbi:c-type cytochrome [uncultured Sphingomonas sp.]|uniref:c-type cytochrome n=1 Tax=uncultured Sphingomonas sp. TaxID=158754 RepID=UPI0025CE5630|nr:c-type cytochrome [uncultured Sphingomonas sp.]
MKSLSVTPWLLAATALALPGIAVSQGGARSVWDGAYSQAQADRGAAAYAQHCAACHGDALGGSDSAPPLSGGTFLGNWEGQSAGALFTRIRTTMPLDNPGSLGGATVADIEAMILSSNGFPAGQADLPPDPSLSNGIAITQAKPAR